MELKKYTVIVAYPCHAAILPDETSAEVVEAIGPLSAAQQLQARFAERWNVGDPREIRVISVFEGSHADLYAEALRILLTEAPASL